MVFDLKPICAQLQEGKQLFGNIDPYCVLYIGDQVFKTDVHNNGGKKPQWSSQFHFPGTANEMNIEVWDKNAINDEKVGEGKLDLTPFIKSGTQSIVEVGLTGKGKKAGTVMIKIKYSGSVSSNKVGGSIPSGNNNFEGHPSKLGY